MESGLARTTSNPGKFRQRLLVVLVCALLVRLVAAIWSQGYIHSDDHFDTIGVAYEWQRAGSGERMATCAGNTFRQNRLAASLSTL